MNLLDIIGIMTIVVAFYLFIADYLRKKSDAMDVKLKRFSFDNILSDKTKWRLMAFLGAISVPLFMFCIACRAGVWEDLLNIAPPTDIEPTLSEYFHAIYRDVVGILPLFVWACLFAGLIIKLYTQGRLRLPKSMVGAGAFASILPFCSCAAVPMAHGMMLGRQMRIRSIMTFLIVVPVLSPIVYILAIQELGWVYLVTEIIAVFALAMLTGILIERLVGVPEPDDAVKGCYSCEGCKTAHMHRGRDSAFLAGWDQFVYLLKYILLGILIGAALAVFIRPEDIQAIIGSQESLFMSLPGLVLVVLIAIPIFICQGQDVLILAALIPLGFPLGHAVAFAIAGNAICISSIPILNATFGKKVTVLVFGAFFFGSIALGMIINGLVMLVG
jgi:uncharacterized membrane protein YraQ (UPF0718 family)